MSRQPPPSMARAIQALLGLVALGAVTVVLTVLLEDQLVTSWAEGNPSLRGTLASGGLDAVRDGPIRPPGFVPVAIVLFLVIAGLLWVLAAFLRAGHEWARISLAVLLGLTAVATLAGIRTGPPAVFVVLAVVSLVLEVLVVVYLFRRDTTAFLRDQAVDDDAPAPLR